jgi:lipoyl(octanoyl) transferase
MAGTDVAATADADRGPARELAVEVVGIGPDQVDYLHAWDYQREVHAQVCSGERPDTLLLLEHPPVFTAGKRTEPHERPTDGTPVIEVDRGGKITWHGPGQLVGYPIVRLDRPIDVVAYVRRLERALIGVCAQFRVVAEAVQGRTGVWIAEDAHAVHVPGLDLPHRARKVAAIGIRVSQGVTMHGFAINCNPDLSWFSRIVPCGIDDADVTSLTAETGRAVTVAEVIPLAEREVRAALATGTGRERERVNA